MFNFANRRRFFDARRMRGDNSIVFTPLFRLPNLRAGELRVACDYFQSLLIGIVCGSLLQTFNCKPNAVNYDCFVQGVYICHHEIISRLFLIFQMKVSSQSQCRADRTGKRVLSVPPIHPRRCGQPPLRSRYSFLFQLLVAVVNFERLRHRPVQAMRECSSLFRPRF